MSDERSGYDIQAIRELLHAAFEVEELWRFCFDRPDLRPIVDRFGPGQGLDDMVDEVMGYCQTQDLWAVLLGEVRKSNPNQYGRFEPRLRPLEQPAAPELTEAEPEEQPTAAGSSEQEPEEPAGPGTAEAEPGEQPAAVGSPEAAPEEAPIAPGSVKLEEVRMGEADGEDETNGDAVNGGLKTLLLEWGSLLVVVLGGLFSWLVKESPVAAGVGWAVAIVAAAVWWYAMIRKVPIPPVLPAGSSRTVPIKLPTLQPWLVRIGLLVALGLIVAVAMVWGWALWQDIQAYREPQFEITALDTLEEDKNAYEVTDMLIWNQDHPEERGVDIAFRLEVRPIYFGKETLGEVVARVSGGGESLEPKTLWDDLDSESGTVQLELSLSEVLRASGLPTNGDPASNPFGSGDEPFEQATLTIEVAKAKELTKPLASEEIVVRNAPWILRSELAWRNGKHEVDAYVKNLGGTGDFTVRYHLVRLHEEIGPDAHPITSGTRTVETWHSPQKLVRLEPGAFFTDTVALPEVTQPGRYLLEAYAFKKQNYVHFQDPGARWEDPETLDTPWWFGRNPVGIHVFLNSHGVSIETIPFRANGWAEAAQPDETGWVSMSVVNGTGGGQAYRLDFTMPTTITGYSAGGLAFVFDDTVDLTGYKYLEVDVTFGCEHVLASLDMRDSSQTIGSVAVGPKADYAPDIEVDLTGNRHTIWVPLETYYSGIDLADVKDMGLGISAEYVQGYHYFVINDIRLLEE